MGHAIRGSIQGAGLLVLVLATSCSSTTAVKKDGRRGAFRNMPTPPWP